MLIKILILAAVIVAAFVIIVATRPAGFRIVRSMTMAAPASTAFAQVNDFHNWQAWSPWAKLDPSMQQSYDGAPAGNGATYSWIGNKKVGEGRMTLTESRPNEFVRITLQFIRPFAATNITEFTFRPEGGSTHVTWSMSGNSNFVHKAFGLFVNMDQLVGRDFEKGLAQMKIITEGKANK
jgi:polyketide cyclase/dehydrase/lipid transport protein